MGRTILIGILLSSALIAACAPTNSSRYREDELEADRIGFRIAVGAGLKKK